MPQLDAIGIVSADLEATVRFYLLVGLEIPESTEDPIDVGEARGPRDLARLPMHQREGRRRGLRSHHGRGIPRQGAAVRCVLGGQRYATVLDPDGNAVDLFAKTSDGD